MKQTRGFSSRRTSAQQARRFALEALGELPGELAASVELMVSELATNCIRHARTHFDLTVRRAAGEIRVEATDYGGGEPAIPAAEAADMSGRGLRIIETLADAWGVRRTRAGGKTVWFTVSAPPAEASRARGKRSSASEGGSRARTRLSRVQPTGSRPRLALSCSG